MKNYESLKTNKEFKSTYSLGKSYANKYLVMYVLKNNLETNRLGISVSKKVGNSVVRHRITRLIREFFRLNQCRLKNGYDIIVIARVNSNGKNYNEIENALNHLLLKMNLLKDV
ncbi:ribonuclease P protein component [Natranaerovirga pectinivora]|uniref:Ribonuclease P protein component n=1 Tax=Natranaerovirga pectinivora TaxID=682400 RepID=A0A4R3MKB6_9FIRM|nr:ribonuclease P protein component [Natranaerovirga pectinivora]TCT12242.1 ribonuclease P protein component [Natranaerovirga pectinivora]